MLATVESPRVVPRNAVCPCGSGARYKRCCGVGAATGDGALHARARYAALAAQRRGELSRAIDGYDAILRTHADDWDVAHMRATALYQLGAIDEARAAFAALLETPASRLPGFWTNAGLVVASACTAGSRASVRAKLDAYRASRRATLATPRASPTVSVVMPAYGHADYVADAIASVFAQTMRPIELIVIDDGSRDATPARCREALDAAPIPVRFASRPNRGAAFTLNEGIALATGDVIQLVNSDDRLPPARIAAMLAALSAHAADWGYARVALIDGRQRRLGPRDDARAAQLVAAQDAALMAPTVGLALLRANSAVSSGNLMFRKWLWHAVGGFRDYRYNHDWDFALRASLVSEPVLVPAALYDYRIHERNTIAEGNGAARSEQRRVMADFVAHAHARRDWPSPYAPTVSNFGDEALGLLGAVGALEYLPRDVLRPAFRAGR
jgi:glycosyltransferase involved in cell wall biosynthesis